MWVLGRLPFKLIWRIGVVRHLRLPSRVVSVLSCRGGDGDELLSAIVRDNIGISLYIYLEYYTHRHTHTDTHTHIFAAAAAATPTAGSPKTRTRWY